MLTKSLLLRDECKHGVSLAISRLVLYTCHDVVRICLAAGRRERRVEVTARAAPLNLYRSRPGRPSDEQDNRLCLRGSHNEPVVWTVCHHFLTSLAIQTV